MPHSKASRIKRFRAAIKAGNTPILKSYLAEAEGIAIIAGLKPNIDIFIPDINYNSLSDNDKRVMRERFRSRKSYRLSREKLGMIYKSEKVRLKERADEIIGEKI